MNAKIAKKIRKSQKVTHKALTEGVLGLYEQASELPLSRRWKLAWAILIGKKDWSK
jgi:hypothetical protein